MGWHYYGSLHEPEPPPPTRVPALDLARGLAVLFMVFVHVLEEWATLPVQRATFGRVVELFGSAPAAPVFMFLMGASVAFSRRRTVGGMLRRGAELLLLGFLLNFLRGTLPAQIGLSLGLVTAEEIAPYSPWNLLWIVDVLLFAGPALAVLGLVGLVRRPWAWVALAAIVVVASPHLWGLRSGSPLLDGVLRHLWGTGLMVSFPVFPWLAFPLVGMAWGTWLRGSDDEERVFLWTLGSGLGLLAAGTGFLVDRGTQLLGNHWRLEPDGVAWVLGFVGVWLWLCRQAVLRLPDNLVFRTLGWWSRNVTSFYVVQWLIIAWGTGLAGHQALGAWPTVGCQAGVVVLAHWVTRGWVRLRRSRRAASDARLTRS